MENIDKTKLEKQVYENLIFSFVELQKLKKETQENKTKSSITKLVKSIKNIENSLGSILEYKLDKKTKKALIEIYSRGMSLTTLELLDEFKK